MLIFDRLILQKKRSGRSKAKGSVASAVPVAAESITSNFAFNKPSSDVVGTSVVPSQIARPKSVDPVNSTTNGVFIDRVITDQKMVDLDNNNEKRNHHREQRGLSHQPISFFIAISPLREQGQKITVE